MEKTFIGFGYKLAETGSAQRVAVWRALKELGAVSLHHGVNFLPWDEASLGRMEELKAGIVASGGRASLMKVVFPFQEDEDVLVAEFNRRRNEEYGEFANNCEQLVWEIDRECGRGNRTFPELEEAEVEAAKLKRWLERLEARDYFIAPGVKAAREALLAAEERLRSFSLEVFRASNRDGADD